MPIDLVCSGDTNDPEGAETIAPPAVSRSSARRTRSSLTRQRRVLVVTVTAAVILTAAGLAAASLLKSPAQAAAETAPPASDVLTAQVESRVVSENVITRGKVLPSRHVEVSSAGLAGEAVRSVVTKGAGSPGSRVRIGSVLVEVSGRPVFALSGSLPAYRDLTTGDTGEDVAQLQRALAALGHSYGKDPLGTFGSGTARAVTALYEQAGYSALRAESVVAEHKDSDHEAVASPSTEPEARQVPLNEGHVLMPAAEAVYISGRDPRIDTVSATVGATAPDTLMTISAGTLMLQGTLELYQKDMVRVGSKVQVYSDSTGARATGTVASVDAIPARAGTDDASDTVPQLQLRVQPDKPLPASFAGQEVRLTIEAASSGKPVLAVPASAVSAGADGRTTVLVQVPGAAPRRVEVRTGMSGDGYVEVIPSGGHIRAGDSVVIGSPLQTDTDSEESP